TPPASPDVTEPLSSPLRPSTSMSALVLPGPLTSTPARLPPDALEPTLTSADVPPTPTLTPPRSTETLSPLRLLPLRSWLLSRLLLRSLPPPRSRAWLGRAMAETASAATALMKSVFMGVLLRQIEARASPEEKSPQHGCWFLASAWRALRNTCAA